MFFFSFNRIF